MLPHRQQQDPCVLYSLLTLIISHFSSLPGNSKVISAPEGGFLAPLPLDLTSRKNFLSGSHTLVSVYNQTRHGHVGSIQQELFDINSQRSLLWSGDTSKDYETIIQISGCNPLNYTGKATKGWGWLSDLQLLPMNVQKGPGLVKGNLNFS